MTPSTTTPSTTTLSTTKLGTTTQTGGGRTATTSARPPGTALVLDERSGPGDVDLPEVLAADGWRSMAAGDVERLRWLSAVRSFAVIVIRGRSPRWLHLALASVAPESPSPVVVLAPDLDDNHSRLLDLGADVIAGADSSARRLLACVRAAVRRSGSGPPQLRYLESEGVRVDLWSRTTLLHGTPIDLTPTEFGILHVLMTHAQVVVPHHDILRSVWNWKYTDERNALRLQINRLRSKLGTTAGAGFVRSVRGVGYSFDRPVMQFADTPAGTGGDLAGPHGSARAGNHGNVGQRQLRTIEQLLLDAPDREAACGGVVRAATEDGLCDVSAVFVRRPGENRMYLVAQRGMPPEWEEAVGIGIPLTGNQYMASEAVSARRVLHFVDASVATRRYGRTNQLLSSSQVVSHVSVPLMDRRDVWGHIGFGRRSDDPFTPTHCMVLEAAGYLLGALFPDSAPTAPPSRHPDDAGDRHHRVAAHPRARSST